MKKIPLKFQGRKLTVALVFALCVAGVAFAAQLQRRSIKATPLSLTTETPLLLPIDRQMLPSRSADPARDISQASPLPAGVGKQAYIRKVEAVDVPEVDIYASILEDNKGTTMGLYSIPSTGGEFTRITYGPFAQNGGVYQDGYYFYSFADTYMGVKVYYSFLYDGNQKNWPSVKGGEQDDARLCACAIANNPVTNLAYGCFFTSTGNGYELGVLDLQNFTRTTICSLSQGWSAAGFTADGTLYAILLDGNLAKVNLTDGTMQPVGATGLPIEGPTSGTIDYRTNTFFYATNATSDHAMYVIDLETGVPTKLYDLPYEAKLGGMFICYPNVDAAAPASVANMQLNFEGPALQGSVEFDAPSLTFGGNPLTGILSYEVSVNDNVVASGNCNAGTHASAPVTLNAPGLYSFTVSVKNSIGASDPVKKTRWVGYDIPAAPQNVSLTYAADRASLSWDAVTTGAHGGYINPSDISYSVVRLPQGTEVATALTATSFSEVLTATTATALCYEIKAHCNGSVSEPATSNTVTFGTIIPPYAETFDSESSLATFTVIDANSDGNTWSFNYDKVQVKFNANIVMDDWLITSPVTLEQGKLYDLTIDVRAHNNEYVPERFEVKWGTQPTAESMTHTVIEPTDVTSKSYTRYTGRISVPTDGVYYIGVHGISPADKYYMYVDNLAISAPYRGETPGEVTDFNITPDYDGRIRGTVSFKAPMLSSNGNPLTSPMNITVSRNDEVVHTFGGIEPGAECSFEDTAPSIGEYRYTVVATNSEGTGSIMAATGRLGVNLAPAPLNVKIEEVEEGTVKLTWESPAKDINGFPLNPDAIHYAILDRTGQNVLAEDLKKTEFTFEVLEPGSGKQNFVFYYILPQTAAGVNYDDYVYTDQIPVGTPYTYPFTESFKDAAIEHSWAITRLEATKGSWGVGPSSQQPEALPQDADGGLAAFMPTEVGDEALFHSGKITIPASAKNPKLSFWYYGVAGVDDRLDVMIYDMATGQYKTIDTRTLSQEGTGWHRVVCALDNYKGQTIRIGFYGVCVSYSALILIDNIKVTEVLDGNLAIASLSAPARMTAGTTDNFLAVITNTGLSAAKDVEVALLRDGQRANTVSIANLPEDTRMEVPFTDTPDVFSSERIVYTASLLWDADTDATDNESAPVTVKVSTPALPRVNDLAATESPQGAVLTWSAPTAGGECAQMLESFENGRSFAIDELEGWTFIDADGKTTYGIEDVTFPNQGKPMAYIIIDSHHQALSREFAALSGHKTLVSFSNDDGSACDNWAISPLLNGKPQTISFSAKAQTNAYGYEAFEFLYSTTDTDPANFIKAGDDKRVNAQWKEYSFDVPQGAKYFAIRCVSDDSFAFIVDDVLFTPAALPAESAPTGYRVYRDREPLMAESLTEPGYTDTAADGSLHSYHVTALYAHGESAPSNEVRLAVSSLQTLFNGRGLVYAKPGQIWCEGLQGMSLKVTTTDGVYVFAADSVNDGLLCSVASGIYVVSLEDHSFKLLVP